MQARYYDPVIGRFYSNDPIGFTGAVDTFNRYAYVANNPYKYTDPTGMSKEFDEKQEQRSKKKHDGCQQDPLCYNAIPWRNSESSDSSGENNSGGSAIPTEPGIVSVCPECYLVGGTALLQGAFTTTKGFLFGSITIKTPINISVQRFGNISANGAQHWGLPIGHGVWANRTFNAIKPAWNPLTRLTIGTIPRGSSITFGIVGPQGFKHPGGLIQFLINSNKVVGQSTKVVR